MIWRPWLREIVLWTVLRTHVETSLLIRTIPSPTARKTWLRSWNPSRSPRSSRRSSPWNSDLVNIQQRLYWKYVFGSLPVCGIGANQWPSSGGRIRSRYFCIKILSFFLWRGAPDFWAEIQACWGLPHRPVLSYGPLLLHERWFGKRQEPWHWPHEGNAGDYLRFQDWYENATPDKQIIINRKAVVLQTLLQYWIKCVLL